MGNKKLYRYIGMFLTAAAFLFVIRAFMLCSGDDIWYDELFTIEFCKRPLGEMLSFAAKDVHPPLYYMITSAGIRIISAAANVFGLTYSIVAAAKIMSVVPFMLMLILGVTVIRKEFGWLTCGIFSFAIMTMPQLPSYTVEIRMYGWAMFFVTATAFAAYRFFMTDRTKGTIIRDAVITMICGIAACYTHYYACIAVVMLYVLMLVYMINLRSKKKCVVGSIENKVADPVCRVTRIGLVFLMPVIILIAYVPWLSVLIGQIGAVKSSYWIQPLTWRTLGGCVKFLFRPDISNAKLSIIIAVILFLIYAVCLLNAYGILKRIRNTVSGSNVRNNVSRSKVSGNNVSISIVSESNVSRCKGSENNVSRSNVSNPCEKEKYDHKNQLQHQLQFGFICFFSMILLILTGFIASVLIRPVFVYRYMIPACGVWWLAFAVFMGCGAEDNENVSDSEILSEEESDCEIHDEEESDCEMHDEEESDSESKQTNKKKIASKHMPIIRNVIMFAMLMVVVFVGIYSFHSFAGNEKYKHVQMAKTDKLFDSIEPGTRIVCNFNHVQALSAYMLDGSDNKIFLLDGAPEELISEMLPSAEPLEDEAEIRTWLRQGGKVLFLGSFNSRDDVLTNLKEKYGISSKDTGSFMAERYWFDVYELSLQN